MAFVGALGRVASAQPAGSAPPPASTAPAPAYEPSPFSFGLALGGGALVFTCDGCTAYAGEAIELHVGWAFGDRFELIAQASGVFHPVSRGWLGSGSADLVARGWLVGPVWLEGAQATAASTSAIPMAIH